MALEDLYEFMEGRPCALLLTDESGCLLAQTGHPDTLRELAALGFGPAPFSARGGSAPMPSTWRRWRDAALRQRSPALQPDPAPWHCCASPVYNSNGRQVAIMALICRVEEASAGDLALTVSAGASWPTCCRWRP
jgi:transcriptional activator for dhaKLM operon